MSALVQVSFDESTGLLPLTASESSMTEVIGLYLRRVTDEPVRVSLNDGSGLGMAHSDSALVATFLIEPLGGAA